MTTLHERLQAVIAEMRRAVKGEAVTSIGDWADRLEAAQALQAAPEGGDALAVAQENGAIGYIHCGQFGRYIEFFDGKDMKDFGEQFLYASPAQPSGFVLVPVEPTEAMLDAACAQHKCVQGDPWYHDDPLPVGDAEAIWAAMLSAAPIEQEG